jgi:hypothetical protein
MYANNELFIEAVAGGERSFMRMLSKREVSGKKLFDQILYPLACDQEEKCREYGPVAQDFDAAYRNLNVISKDTVNGIKAREETGYSGAAIITIAERFAPPLYKYRQAAFFKVLDFKAQRKYAMLPKMAAVKVCGRLYVALNAVCVRAENPIIVTVDG